jgi:uncharacterized membrane protein YphA (DoxX/SURF4 family)
LLDINAAMSVNATGLIGLIAGVLLVIGFFTAIISLAVGVLCACGLMAFVPATYAFGSGWVAMLAGAMGFSITLLGPGALSADARLFGPREIVIPAATHIHRTGTDSSE